MIGMILVFIVYIVAVIILSIIISEKSNQENIVFRIIAYMITSLIFSVIILMKVDNVNNKHEYHYEKCIIKNGIDKDTIIINKKY